MYYSGGLPIITLMPFSRLISLRDIKGVENESDFKNFHHIKFFNVFIIKFANIFLMPLNSLTSINYTECDKYFDKVFEKD